MKKFTKLILATAVFVAVGCLAAYLAVAYAAPAAIGAAVFGKALNTVSKTLDIPTWAEIALFLSFGPAFIIWLMRLTSKRRTQVAILIVGIAAACLLILAVKNHRQDFAHLVHGTISHAERIFLPVEQVDPTATQWFDSSGDAKLFYTRPTTNSWLFFRAFLGAHDPQSGSILLPVTPMVRQEWAAARQMEQERTAAVQKATEERQHEQELAATAQKEAEERRKAEEAAAERSRLEQQVTAQQRKVDELLEKLQASAQQQSQPVAEQRQSDPPPAPAYTPPPVVSTTTYVVNIPPPPPVYYYAPPPPPRVTYYYYPTVRTYWVAPRPYVFAPPAPRYYFRR